MPFFSPTVRTEPVLIPVAIMENASVEPKPTRNPNTELTVALVAVIISLSTLFVYLYQSNLMKTQQKMSVWPHVTFGPSWSLDNLSINMINKGVGPAIIRSVDIQVDGERLGGIQDLMSRVPDSLRSDYYDSSIWPGQVLMSGESIQVFQNGNPETIRHLLSMFKEDQVRIRICYCSVYDDCWTSTGTDITEGGCEYGRGSERTKHR